MNFKLFKLSFDSGVHFGNGSLDESEKTFCSDTLFSALCIELVKMGEEYLEEFVDCFKRGNLLLSDAFPYIDDNYYLPKPFAYVESDESAGDSIKKKRYKKLEYINSEYINDFLDGNYPEQEFQRVENGLGMSDVRTYASIRGETETKPYRVGVYRFYEESGLYFVLAYNDEDKLNKFRDYIQLLELVGIGGKRHSGLGRFKCIEKDVPECILARLEGDYSRYMNISITMPTVEELETALKNAEYGLVKRSGFIQSDSYSSKQRKKKDCFMFKSGSCFDTRFTGDIFDVSDGGSHPVYKYGKGLFIGIVK